jgi:hypothetical protein
MLHLPKLELHLSSLALAFRRPPRLDLTLHYREDGGCAALWPLPYSFRVTCSSSTNRPTFSYASSLSALSSLTNPQDLEATVWLERFLSSREGTLIVTAHDIAFLDNVAEESIAIKFKKLDYFEGTPSAWEVQRVKEARRFKGQKEAMDKKRDHVDGFDQPLRSELTMISCRLRSQFSKGKRLRRKAGTTTSTLIIATASSVLTSSQTSDGQVSPEEVRVHLYGLFLSS